MAKFSARLARVSAYAHTEDHLRVKTSLGGLITLLGAALAMVLFASEARRCLATRRVQDMVVDTELRPRMRIEFDLTFPALPCHALRLDTGDVGGRFETESMHRLVHDGEVHKWRLDSSGRRIERHEYIPPRGRDNPFVLTLDADDIAEVRDAVVAGEGCSVFGWLLVQRVAGNVHFAVRPEAILAVSESQEALEALFDRHLDVHGGAEDVWHAQQLNASHTIRTLRFGQVAYPGQVQPLEGVARVDRKATGIDKYFIKVVPTVYRTLWGWATHTYSYSVTEYWSPLPEGSRAMPGVYLLYDTSPIAVHLTESRAGLLHLLVRGCAVSGGVWAVTGVVNRGVHRGLGALRRAGLGGGGGAP